MTINNLVNKLVRSTPKSGLRKKHTLYYCFQCMDEYVLGQRTQIAFKVDSGKVFYRKPPTKNMRHVRHASSMLCDEHWEHRKKYIKG